MKKISYQFSIYGLLLGLISFYASTGNAQKLMKISNELNQYADSFEVTMKGWGSMTKYQYNDYRVTKSKSGWTKSKYNSKLFSSFEHASSESKLSFEFVSENGDSSWVNLNRKMDYQGINQEGFTFFGMNSSITLGEYQEVLENADNLFGIIETNFSDTTWNFIVSETYGSNVKGGSSFKGWLTNGNRKIDINPIFEYQNPGKKSTVDMMLGSEIWLKGFEFFEHSESIGAVQVGPLKKMYVVWFSKKNDPMTNFIMGSTFAALIHQYQMVID